jgi:CubicO group peptidase (beta-lactamase class C family)
MRLLLLLALATALGAQPLPITGSPADRLPDFDRALEELMLRLQTEGATVAVVKDHRLVYARGMGYADRASGRVMEAESLGRIASISKALTLLALHQLALHGRVDLQERVYERLLKGYLPANANARFRDIRLGHLAAHTSGLSGDARCSAQQAAVLVQGAEPASADDMARAVPLMVPFRRNPGVAYEYNNAGYLLLGRAMEQAGNEALEAFVRRMVFAPLGLHRPRMARTRAEDFSTRETLYADNNGQRMVSSVFPTATRPVPLTEGMCLLEAQEALGGWTASAIDLALLYARRNGVRATQFGDEFALQEASDYAFYGLFPEGTASVVRRLEDGTAFAAIFNSGRPAAAANGMNEAIDNTLRALMRETKEWPTADEGEAYREKWRVAFPARLASVPAAMVMREGGAAPESFVLDLQGPEGMPFRVSTHALWLRPSMTSGVLPVKLRVEINANGLRAGTWRDQLLIEHATEFSDPLSVPVQLTVQAAEARVPALRILPPLLPYRETPGAMWLALTATGGTAPLRWTLASGSLPPGAAMDENGKLSGTITENGLFEWVVRVEDANGWRFERGMHLAVGVPGFPTIRVRRTYATAAAANQCAAPREQETFAAGAARVGVFVDFEGSLAIGDRAQVQWLRPDGSTAHTEEEVFRQGYASLWGPGCFYLDLPAAQRTPAAAGQWKMLLRWNGAPAGEASFRIE